MKDHEHTSTSYKRENIALWEPPVCWAVRWQRPGCGCFLMCGLIPDPNKAFDRSELLWTMKGCPDHEREIEVVLRTMKEMPPCDEEVGALFTRLLEAEIQ